MAFTIDFINIYTFIYMMITKYPQAIMELNDFPKLFNLLKVDWINSTLILIYNNYKVSPSYDRIQ